MKKIFYLFLVGAMMIGVSSCSTNPAPEDGGNTNPETEVTIAIEVSDITAVSATVNITPSDTAKYYMFAYDSYSNFKEYGYEGDDEFAMKDDFSFWANVYWPYYEEAAKEYGYDFYSFLLNKGNYVDGEIDGMEPETEYIAYAYYVEINGADTILSGFSSKRFTTAAAEKSNITFAIDVDGANVVITPSNNDMYWYALIDNETLYDEEEGYAGDAAEALLSDYTFLSYFYEDLEPITGVENFELGELAYQAGAHTLIVAGFNGYYLTTDVTTKVVEVTEDMLPEDEDYESPRKANKQKVAKQLKTTKHRLAK